MKEKRLLLLAGLLILPILAFQGCYNSDINSQVQTGQANQEKISSYSMEEVDGYRIEQFEINPNEGWNISDISANENAIYYMKGKPIPAGQVDGLTQVVELRGDTGKEELIYSYDQPSFFNELRATPDSLFWVRFENEQRKIERFNLKSRELTIVRTISEERHPICLETDSKYLAWFDENDMKKLCLYVLDIASGTIRVASDEVARQSPYCRAQIRNGRIAFGALNKVTEEAEFHIYDIENDVVVKKIPFRLFGVENQDIRKCVVTDRFLYFSVIDDNDEDNSIYAMDYNSGVLYGNINKADTYLFSFQTLGDEIIINARNALWVNNPVQGSSKKILQRREEAYLLSNNVIMDRFFVTHDEENSSILRVTKM
ncbi:MAG: hypothetical protein LBL49_03390 [Clostridiales Family XIII bacterium]|jgi:hypothetical protein|nr:hypothetical protein [Clostridiales Family XIII bacterium]